MYMQPILDGWANMVITAPCRRLFNCLHVESHESSASAMELRRLLCIYMGSPMTRVVNNGWTSRINDNGQKWSVGIQRTFVGAERRGPSALAMELRHLYAVACTVTCKRIPTWSYIAWMSAGNATGLQPWSLVFWWGGGGGGINGNCYATIFKSSCIMVNHRSRVIHPWDRDTSNTAYIDWDNVLSVNTPMRPLPQP